MTKQEQIEEIKRQFATGQRFIELPHNDPVAFRRTLYRAVRRRGLLWMFATSNNSVFVINDSVTNPLGQSTPLGIYLKE